VILAAPDKNEAKQRRGKLLINAMIKKAKLHIIDAMSMASIFDCLSPIFPRVNEKKIHPKDVNVPKIPKLNILWP